ncbi:MAG: hypothetical protein ACPF9W_08585, partial [Nocardioides sp.]
VVAPGERFAAGAIDVEVVNDKHAVIHPDYPRPDNSGFLLDVGGTVSVQDTTMTKNRSERAGGGLETAAGTVDLAEVDMSDNSTGDIPGNGGALHLTGAAQVTWNGGTVTGNDAAAQGGGLWNSETGLLVVIGVDVSGNTAPEGADVYNDGGIFLQDGLPVPPAGLGLPLG